MTEFIHENIRLIHGDCMDYMQDLPDNAFDLAIVDPPYGIGAGHKNFINSGNKHNRDIYRDVDWDTGIPDREYFEQLMRISKNQIICGGNYFNLPPSRCWVVWDKGVSIDMSYAMAELFWTSFDEVTVIYKNNNKTEDRIHPTQKPVQLYKWLLKNYATPDMKIIDTHLGSGSSAIAAWEYKCKEFVGIEIDKEYYDAGVKRFKNHIAQKKLF